jgi:hypothetical protein
LEEARQKAEDEALTGYRATAQSLSMLDATPALNFAVLAAIVFMQGITDGRASAHRVSMWIAIPLCCGLAVAEFVFGYSLRIPDASFLRGGLTALGFLLAIVGVVLRYRSSSTRAANSQG